MALVTWLQRLGGFTLEAQAQPTGISAEACPACGIALLEVSVQRELRLFGARLQRSQFPGYRCLACARSFARQSGLARWLDVALMAPLVLVLGAVLGVVSVWTARAAWSFAQGGALGSDVLVAAAFLAAAALLFWFPARSLARRIRIATSRGLTWMDETFTASV
jgi:hypothetical protein